MTATAKATEQAPTKTITVTTTISGKGRPAVAELMDALGTLPERATVTDVAFTGGKTAPAWRVTVETVSEA